METDAPLCKPMPEHSTVERIVCSRIKTQTRCEYLGYIVARNSGCGKKATVRGWGITSVNVRGLA